MSAEEQLRRRLAEIASSGGLPRGQQALQVLYMLPEPFLRSYEELFHKALRTGDEGKGSKEAKEAELGIARRGQKGKGEDGRGRGKDELGSRTIGGVTSGGKRYKRHWVVRDTQALGKKTTIDRKLRALAREINGGEDRTQVRCPRQGCRKYLDGDWSFCPWCGAEMKADEKAAKKTQ